MLSAARIFFLGINALDIAPTAVRKKIKEVKISIKVGQAKKKRRSYINNPTEEKSEYAIL